jgi:hypothetical protein
MGTSQYHNRVELNLIKLFGKNPRWLTQALWYVFVILAELLQPFMPSLEATLK